jgi:SynChlorMet cassette protein ScmC
MKDEHQSLSFILSLADGTHLALCAGDASAARVVTFLARAAQLSPASLTPTSPSVGEGRREKARCLLAVTEGKTPPAGANSDAICLLEPPDAQRPRRRRIDGSGVLTPVFETLTEEQWLWVQLVRLSACIARETHHRGGVLLHSGLAVCPHPQPLPRLAGEGEGGKGVLLAGRSGVGKSTASARLPLPWRALADDVTLVVRDGSGTYWAHPWPTWSRFFGEEAGDGSDAWDVQRAVELQAIFVLEQGEEVRAKPLGPGHAVCLLAELAQQTSMHLLRGWPMEEIAGFNLQRFENLCALARAVPVYLLHVSLDGAFWEAIEQAIR